MPEIDKSLLPQDLQDAYDSLFMRVDTNIKLESVILSEENKELIDEFLTETKYADKFVAYGLEPMNRLLFYGASGCGKTFLSKALSNHLGYPMLYVDIATALSNNQVAKNLSEIFRIGNIIGHCIIFLDECDSIAWNRDSENDSGMVRRATNTLFQHLDQMNHTNIFISATNLLHKCDPAFERRFNLKMQFTRPDVDLVETTRKFVNEMFFRFIDDADPVTVDIVKRRTFLSYYEIQGVAERAMKKAVIDGTMEVHTKTIFDDYRKILGLKYKFGTAEDDANIFESPSQHAQFGEIGRPVF